MEQILWTEKYRPTKIADCVLPAHLKAMFEEFVAQDRVLNLLLVGRPGVGKTTVAKAMLDMMGADYLVINASMRGNIDTLRTDILNFASTMSLTGGRKYVILDEADYLNANSTQPALRNFMEEFSKNCGFILTANYRNKIIEALQSRCTTVEFTIPADEKAKMAAAFFDRANSILSENGVEFDKKAVAAVIQKHFPDWRKVLNQLQGYASANGRIDAGIVTDIDNKAFVELIGLIKSKDFTSARKWIAERKDQDSATLFRMFYETSPKYFKPQSIPQLVLILAEYQYKEAFVADHELNMAACITEIMASCEVAQ